MPRTRQLKKDIKRDPATKSDKEIALQLLREAELAQLQVLDEEEMKLANFKDETASIINMIKNDIQNYLHIKLKDMDSVNVSKLLTTITETNTAKKKGRPKLKRSISETAIETISLVSSISKSSTISNGSDSGNSTSSCLSRSRSIVRSGNSTQKGTAKTLAQKNRRSRSLSRSGKQHMPLEFGKARSTMRTPLGQKVPIMGPITPKIKSFDAIPTVRRHAKRNEIAVSLQGSPLVVNPVTEGVNANIPLSDGRIIALQPQNMRFSDIADLSLGADSISDLKRLQDNIARICENYHNKHEKK